MIIGIQSKYARDLWSRVEPLLNRLDSEDTGYTPEDILAAIERRDMQLWVTDTFDTVGITFISVKPQWKSLHIFYVCGENMDAWKHEGLDLLEAYARHNNCKYVTAQGRRGWTRALKDRGYLEDMVNIRRKVA